MQLVDPANSTFTTHELERLAVYRTAVAAGFYTDWDGSAETTDSQVLAWLGSAGDGPVEAAGYPFTAEERQRMERCRAAVAGGYYTDDLPPADAPATPDGPVR